MNVPGSAGEPSCKRQENGDASTGSDRPLKKARFAWQVKGKYHLKNETPDNPKTLTTADEPEKALSSNDESETNSLVGNTEQNLEILGDYLLKQDFNTLDSVITDSDKPLLKPSTSIPTVTLEYPRYISSCDNNRSRTSSSSLNDDISIPVSMVVSNNYTEEQCIARWQARQMAKGFVDNTINRVLDSWMITPMPTYTDNNRFLAVAGVAEFINNLPGDNSIENEGILMAISAHGLQNTSSSSSNHDEQLCNSSNTKDAFAFPSRSNSPLQLNEDTVKPISTTAKSLDANIGSFNDLHMAWSYDDDRDVSDVNNSVTPFSIFPDTSSSSYLNYSDNDHQNSQIEDENAFANDTDILNSHYDFMDAAVSFAIQSKGLTSFGTDYG